MNNKGKLLIINDGSKLNPKHLNQIGNKEFKREDK